MKSKFLLASILLSLFACKVETDKRTQDEAEVEAPAKKEIILPSQQEALESLNDAIAENAESDSLYFQRALFYLTSDDDENGFYDLYKAIQLNNRVEEYYMTGALHFIKQQDLRSAMGLVEDGLKAIPNSAQLNLEMAKMNLYIRQYDKVSSFLAKALEVNPNYKEAYMFGAISSKEQDKMDLAKQSLAKAIAIDPDYYEALFLLGEYYAPTDYKVALAYYQNALRVLPDNPEILYAIGLLHQESDKPEAAKKSYREILKFDKQNEDAFYNLGYIYLQQDSFEMAHRHFGMAVAVSPTAARCYYMRGYCSELMEDFQEAKKDFEQALVFDGELENAKRGLKRIKQSINE